MGQKVACFEATFFFAPPARTSEAELELPAIINAAMKDQTSIAFLHQLPDYKHGGIVLSPRLRPPVAMGLLFYHAKLALSFIGVLSCVTNPRFPSAARRC